MVKKASKSGTVSLRAPRPVLPMQSIIIIFIFLLHFFHEEPGTQIFSTSGSLRAQLELSFHWNSVGRGIGIGRCEAELVT